MSRIETIPAIGEIASYFRVNLGESPIWLPHLIMPEALGEKPQPGLYPVEVVSTDNVVFGIYEIIAGQKFPLWKLAWIKSPKEGNFVTPWAEQIIRKRDEKFYPILRPFYDRFFNN